MIKGREILIYLYCVKYNFDWDKTYADITSKIDIDEEIVKESVDKFSFRKKCITLLDEDYPDDLKTYFKPPFVIVLGAQS